MILQHGNNRATSYYNLHQQCRIYHHIHPWRCSQRSQLCRKCSSQRSQLRRKRSREWSQLCRKCSS
jgi:hypothetical protein